MSTRTRKALWEHEFEREELSAGKLGDKARSGSTLTLTPIHPTTIPAPEREGNVLPSGTALGLSRLRSEWPLPGPESATSSPGNKHSNVGNGGAPKQTVGDTEPSGMKCRELGHWGTESHGNREVKRQKTGC